MEWFSIVLTVFGVFAAVLAIADFVFSKVSKGKKILIIILAGIICLFAYERIELNTQNRIAKEKQGILKRDAKSVCDSIMITGWENPGDYIGYLTQLVGFYQRHKELYQEQANVYKSELSNWRALLVERRREGRSLTLNEEMDLRGLAASGKKHLLQIVEKY